MVPQTNNYGQAYLGNDDFRGWLAGNPNGSFDAAPGQSTTASNLLNYVGNDGKVGNVSDPFLSSMLSGAANKAYSQWVGGRQTPINQVSASSPTSGNGVNADFINQAYDTKIAGLKSIFDTLDPQQNAATLNVQNQYQNQSNALQGQQAQGQRNLNMATDQIQQSKARNLDDLRRQLDTMGMSYSNQLGAFGAGDSSATGMIQQALGGQASRQRAGVMQQAGNQQQMIDAQGNDLNSEFQNNMKSLNDWKSSSLNDIASKFLQQKQMIQQQMTGANADRYQALAAADANYTNQAISQLSALENTYRQNANDLVNQYQNIMAPNAQISPNLMQYAVQPMNPQQLNALQTVPALQTNTDPSAFMMRRPQDQNLGFNLGF